ncbi:MAG: hypothetical protein NXI35_32930 [bacterium]|nr:hypothetical protein [bacterium]
MSQPPAAADYADVAAAIAARTLHALAPDKIASRRSWSKSNNFINCVTRARDHPSRRAIVARVVTPASISTRQDMANLSASAAPS